MFPAGAKLQLQDLVFVGKVRQPDHQAEESLDNDSDATVQDLTPADTSALVSTCRGLRSLGLFCGLEPLECEQLYHLTALTELRCPAGSGQSWLHALTQLTQSRELVLLALGGAGTAWATAPHEQGLVQLTVLEQLTKLDLYADGGGNLNQVMPLRNLVGG